MGTARRRALWARRLDASRRCSALNSPSGLRGNPLALADLSTMLYAPIGAMQLDAVRRFKDWNMGRLDLVNAFIKDTETLGDRFVRKYPDTGYSTKQLTNLVDEFRVGIREIELKYMLIIRSGA